MELRLFGQRIRKIDSLWKHKCNKHSLWKFQVMQRDIRNPDKITYTSVTQS